MQIYIDLKFNGYYSQYIKNARILKNLEQKPSFSWMSLQIRNMPSCGVVKPKKPNSAQRKIVKLNYLTNVNYSLYTWVWYGLQKNSEVWFEVAVF